MSFYVTNQASLAIPEYTAKPVHAGLEYGAAGIIRPGGLLIAHCMQEEKTRALQQHGKIIIISTKYAINLFPHASGMLDEKNKEYKLLLGYHNSISCQVPPFSCLATRPQNTVLRASQPTNPTPAVGLLVVNSGQNTAEQAFSPEEQRREKQQASKHPLANGRPLMDPPIKQNQPTNQPMHPVLFPSHLISSYHACPIASPRNPKAADSAYIRMYTH